MQSTTTFNLIVVGGGIAGLVGANRAAQAGLRVAVLEKGTAEKYPCNTRFTGGAFHVAYRDVMTDADALLATIRSLTAEHFAPERAGPLAIDGRRAYAWLQAEGMRFVKGGVPEYLHRVFAPPRRQRAGQDWEGRGGDVLLRTLEANLGKRGGAVLRGHRARELMMADGRCVGVRAETSGGTIEFGARAVLIADGGFQGNLDLLGRYNIARAPTLLQQRGAGTGCGDGLRMAETAGAALTGLGQFYGHILSADALRNDRLSPYPILDHLALAGIIVDRQGRRIINEGLGGVAVANEIARLDDPLSTTLIFDRTAWETAGRQHLIPVNPTLIDAGATVHQSADIGSLAALAGLPADGLKETVATFNAAASGGRLQSLSPQRDAGGAPPAPIRTPPFFAVNICAGITYTMGGIVIDENSRALRPDRSPIEGLFAAGAATGGLEGGPKVAYIGGLVMCAVTALRAAEELTRSIKG